MGKPRFWEAIILGSYTLSFAAIGLLLHRLEGPMASFGSELPLLTKSMMAAQLVFWAAFAAALAGDGFWLAGRLPAVKPRRLWVAIGTLLALWLLVGIAIVQPLYLGTLVDK